jgi:hypothetical protein
VVGYYVDSSGILHGYYWDANGALHFPIDPSGSVGTVLFGDNERNWVVGRYAGSSGVTHGLFLTAVAVYPITMAPPRFTRAIPTCMESRATSTAARVGEAMYISVTRGRLRKGGLSLDELLGNHC